MTEWSVILVIVTLVGLVSAIVTPLIKVNTSATKLVCAVEALEKNLEKIITKNSESHDRLWKHNEAQDRQLANHETRIKVMEYNDGSCKGVK